MGQALQAFARGALGVFSPSTIGPPASDMLTGITPGAIGEPPPRGTREHLQVYSDTPWVRAIVSRIADSVASAEWRLYVAGRPGGPARADGVAQRAKGAGRTRRLKALRDAGDLREITTHLFLDTWALGNAFQTGHATRKTTQVHLEAVGDAFLLKERNGLGAVVALWPVPAPWVLSTPTPSRPLYRMSYRGWQATIPETEVLWLNDPNPSNPYGRGTGLVRALGDEIETDEYAAKVTKQFFFNSARPDLLITPKTGESLDQAEARRVELSWMQKMGGFWNRWKPMFLTRGVDVYEFEKDFRAGQFVQIRQHERDICHDDQTECLTRRGWIRGLELRDDDEIAAWDHEKQQMRYVIPQAVIRRHYAGPMHYWQTANVDAAVTPDHRLLVWSERAQGWQFMRSEEVVRQERTVWWQVSGAPSLGVTTVSIPAEPYTHTLRYRRAVAGDTLSVDAISFARWLGYYLSEGSATAERSGRYRLEYGQAAPGDSPVPVGVAEKMVQAAKALGAAGLGSVSVHRRGQNLKSGKAFWRIAVSSKSLWTWVRRECGTSAQTKQIPTCVFSWHAEAQRTLLEAMIEGDGHLRGPETMTITTSSQRLGDGLQAIGVHLGLRASLVTRLDARHQAIYTVLFSSRGVAQVYTRACQEKPYDGLVWCVDVGGQAFVTRRAGHVAVHGNCLQTWGMPPEVLGVIENSNRSTIEAADYLYNANVIVPRLEFLRASLQERLLPEYDARLILDYVSPVAEDRTYLLEVAKAAPWAREVDEWRAAQGLEPLLNGAGRVFMVPTNVRAVATPADAQALQPQPFGGGTPGQEPGQDEPPPRGLAALDDEELRTLRRLTAKAGG